MLNYYFDSLILSLLLWLVLLCGMMPTTEYLYIKSRASRKKVKTTYRHTAHSFIQPLLKRDRVCMHAIVGLLSDRMLERSSVYICISDEGHQILLLCSFKLISSSPSLCFLILINQKEQVNSWRNKVRDIRVVQSIIDDKTFGIWYSTNCIDILLYK
jgi:hypothetical protein